MIYVNKNQDWARDGCDRCVHQVTKNDNHKDERDKSDRSKVIKVAFIWHIKIETSNN